MTILRDISQIWSLLHTLVLFAILFESRYSKKKTLILTLSTMLPLIAINFILALISGPDSYGMILLLTLSLPSLIFFWFLAKHRDGRFFFTFCLVDTSVLEIIYITQIINYYVTPDSNIFMFVVRLLIFPCMEWIIYKKLRSTYLDIQHYGKAGWGTFALISAVFYVVITLLCNYPTSITKRPEYLPVVILIFLLMPILYLHIFNTMHHQHQIQEMSEQENILRLQVKNMAIRMEELTEADRKFRMERHNFRHKLKAIASLVETEQYGELRTLLAEYNESISETQVKRYCQNAVIDALLSSYIQRAQNKGIKVNFGFAFPDVIPVNETELATVLANALENAINACEKLDVHSRFINIKVLNHPRFMIQIVNSFNGQVEFDENDVPVNHEDEHGFGTRSIVAFCEKHGAYYQFKAEGQKFILYLNF